jgi:hypothetical protein
VGSSAVYYCGASGCNTFILGGRLEYSPDDRYVGSIWSYNSTTRVATKVADLPTEPGAVDNRHQDGAAVVIGDTIYYFGGAVIVCAQLNAPPAPCSAVPKSAKGIIAFRPDQPVDNVTNPKIVATLPDGLWGLQAIAANGKAYLFGGFTFNVTNGNDGVRRDWIIGFDPSAGQGPTAILLPQALPFHEQDGAAAYVGGDAYVLGGLVDNNANNPCPDMMIWNSDGTYRDAGPAPSCASDAIVAIPLNVDGRVGVANVVARLPSAVDFVSASAIGDRIVISPGRNESGGVEPQVRSFNTSTRLFDPVDSEASLSLFGMPMISDAGRFLMFGGRAASLSDMTDNITEVDLGPVAPCAPENLAGSVNARSIELNWSAPSCDGGRNITSYSFYRASGSANGTLLNSTSQTSAVDAAPPAGETLTYYVTASNVMGESLPSVSLVINMPNVPGAPLGVSVARQQDPSAAVIDWRLPQDGGEPISTFTIIREWNGSTQRWNVSGNTSAFVDTDAPTLADASYEVTAANAMGDGPASPPADLPPVRPPAPPIVTAVKGPVGAATLTWAAPSDSGGAPTTGFVVYCGDSPSNLSKLVETNMTSFIVTGLIPTSSKDCQVSAVNLAGEGPRSPTWTLETFQLPRAPTRLEVQAGPAATEMTLRWVAPNDTDGLALVAYRIYDSTKQGAERFLTNLSPSNTTFTTTVGPGTYFFQVSAVTAAGEGPRSDEWWARSDVMAKGSPGLDPGLVLLAGAGISVFARRSTSK